MLEKPDLRYLLTRVVEEAAELSKMCLLIWISLCCYWILEVKRMKKQLTNAKFAESNPDFRQACLRAGIEATRRQASKWRMKKGKAWKEGRH